MTWLEHITKENFQDSFNLKCILTNSVFYPNAGCDGSDIEWFSASIVSFVHSDERVIEEDVRTAMTNDFNSVGYDLVGLKRITLANFKFAIWAVYSLRDDARHYSHGKQKAKCFSILHVCAPHKIAFTYLYEMNSINPIGIFEKTAS